MPSTRLALAAALLLATPLAGQAAGGRTYRATIRTTSYGLPHIKASDLGSAAFGYAYAFAVADLCTIADRWVTLRGERSRFFGVEGPRDGRQAVTNLQSDFYYKWIDASGLVEQELAAPPPVGPTPEVREMVRGYVAGYNHYLSTVGVANITDKRCRGKPWVRPITEKDVWLRSMNVTALTAARWIGPIIDAVQPGDAPAVTQPSRLDEPAPRLTMSNVVALGREATDNGKGMVFINPHWRWHEPERFFEAHLTVPGKLDVYGGSFGGVPLIMLGFNRHVAWSHTASVPKRETIYQLKLTPGNPTSYEYEGASRPMTSRTVKVMVKEDDGRLVERSHTVWETHFGPVIATGAFVWTGASAYAVRMVGNNFRWLNQHYGMNTARTIEELDEAGKRHMALGWLNTIGADDQGRVIYGDRSSVPHVTDEQRVACTTSEQGKQLWNQQQLIVFDGWRKDCEWGTDPDAPVPGIFGPKRLPGLDRWDYATNSNDSHWANHARQLLEGYPAVVGDEKTPRSLRTRNGLTKIEKRLAGTDGRPGNKFTLAQFEEITLDNRVYSAELWRDALVGHCRTLPRQAGIPEACDVLAKWDMTDEIDSRGSVLWRRFMENLTGAPQPDTSFFTKPFDPRDPTNTPSGLNVSNPRVTRALTQAIGDLRANGMALDARLREAQVEQRSGLTIPIHGGPMQTGAYSLIMNNSGWVPGKGWNTIMHASSYIAWVQYTDKGPVGHTILASSQSDDPASPHHADQTVLFSKKQWKPILFDEAAIKADKNLKVVTICRTAAGAACR